MAIWIRPIYVFVQCSLLRPPHEETDSRCKHLAWLGVLVPAGQMGEIQASHPVWAANNRIIYKDCNTWAGGSSCGLFSIDPSSTKGYSNGFLPTQLTHHTSDVPTDTKGNWVAFMSQQEGNWESYVMDLNGGGVKNLSNSPFNDGLGSLSPGGNWVAFVSDRSGEWAVWAVSVAGGEPQKILDLPEIPWANGHRTWTNERISWGP